MEKVLSEKPAMRYEAKERTDRVTDDIGTRNLEAVRDVRERQRRSAFPVGLRGPRADKSKSPETNTRLCGPSAQYPKVCGENQLSSFR